MYGFIVVRMLFVVIKEHRWKGNNALCLNVYVDFVFGFLKCQRFAYYCRQSKQVIVIDNVISRCMG